MWAAPRELPRGDAADVLNHGDLMPGNVLVSADRRLAGVLDVGELGGRPGPRPGERLASARRRAAAGAARIARLERPGVGARPGVGVSAVDGPGLVLHRQQPGHGRHRTAHAGPSDVRWPAVTGPRRPFPPALHSPAPPWRVKKDQSSSYRTVACFAWLRRVSPAASPDAPCRCPATRPGSYQAMVAGTVVVVGGSGSGVYRPRLKTPNRKTGLSRRTRRARNSRSPGRRRRWSTARRRCPGCSSCRTGRAWPPPSRWRSSRPRNRPRPSPGRRDTFWRPGSACTRGGCRTRRRRPSRRPRPPLGDRRRR